MNEKEQAELLAETKQALQSALRDLEAMRRERPEPTAVSNIDPAAWQQDMSQRAAALRELALGIYEKGGELLEVSLEEHTVSLDEVVETMETATQLTDMAAEMEQQGQGVDRLQRLERKLAHTPRFCEADLNAIVDGLETWAIYANPPLAAVDVIRELRDSVDALILGGRIPIPVYAPTASRDSVYKGQTAVTDDDGNCRLF